MCRANGSQHNNTSAHRTGPAYSMSVLRTVRLRRLSPGGVVVALGGGACFSHRAHGHSCCRRRRCPPETGRRARARDRAGPYHQHVPTFVYTTTVSVHGARRRRTDGFFFPRDFYLHVRSAAGCRHDGDGDDDAGSNPHAAADIVKFISSCKTFEGPAGEPPSLPFFYNWSHFTSVISPSSLLIFSFDTPYSPEELADAHESLDSSWLFFFFIKKNNITINDVFTVV